jgi:glycosyltransferase involved in cell wall biosynthesis
LRSSWQQGFIRQFDAVIVYSSKGAAEYEKAGFSKDRIYVSFNAVVQAPVSDAVVERTKSNEKPVLVFVGRLQRRKNLDLLFSACAKLSDRYKPEILVVGDGPYRSTFEQQAESTYPETRFLGSIYGEDLEEIYQQADLFVLPGTGGLAVQEAMAHGLPVIVGKGDGTQSDLVRPENGWILPENDPETLSDLLQHALSDSEKLSRMGLESYRIVRDEINIGTMSDVFVKCLNDVSSGGAGK